MGAGMSFIGRLMLAAVCCALAACAIHPLPENVTGVKTSQIVHRNRCEARDALLDAERQLIDKKKPRAVTTLQQIGIVLSYTLDMTESDSLTASTTFEQLLTKGSWTFNPNAMDALKRENRRVFTVADNYQTLKQMRNTECAAVPIGPNYQYPIVGTIGIDEMIRTFLTMALHEDLNGTANANQPPTDPSKSIAGPPAMVDTITFTTTLTAGVMPTIMLTPVGTLTQLTNASLTAMLMRADMHEVTVGMGLPTVQAPEDSTRRYVAYSVSSSRNSLARVRTPLLIDASVPTGTNASTGKSVALEAVNNQIIRFQVLPRAVIIAP